MKKIFVILPDLRGGGAEKVTTNLCNEFINYLNVEVLVMNTNGVFHEDLDKRIIVHDMKINKIRNIFIKLPKLIKKRKPDLILAQMWPITSITTLIKFIFNLKIKVFVCEHVNLRESIKNETKFNYIFAFIFIYLTHNLVEKVITVSEGVKNHLINDFKISTKKISVIYNPIINSKFKNSLVKKRDDLWSKNTKLKLLSVGSLKRQKNFSYLIETLSIIKHYGFELIIIGEGEEKNNLIKLIEKFRLQEQVKLIGFKKNLNEWYYNADIFILPSLWEGFGNVIVEALFYNLKVISTDCNYGPKEILNNTEFGYLAPLNDKIKFAELIIDVSKKDKLITQKRAFDFEVSLITKKYLRLFDNAR